MEWLVARQVCSRSVLLRPTTYTTLNRSYAVIKPATPIFKKYPVPPVEEPSSLKTHPTHLPQLSKQLRYPLLHPNIDIQKEPYSQPLGGTEKLPFRFTRTTSNQLPIYTDFKQRDVKKEYTVLRKITGDVKELVKEVSLLIPGAKIQERAGSIVIEGQHSNLIRAWLIGLGF